ncbi:Dabb family protein [Psychromonas antarctica]|jgi:hypothetical protein|uniref:Dabb family protein n=1 Tax=Psychromonas antarctica TaxID=67573 RepID=UPI001EE7E805|nr:Dabb family protein [Psychromonas antarctica]MCG6201205.1 Dabb family protein [Psychromonas antarctica]
MIRHILLLRFKTDTTAYALAELQAAFAAMTTKVDGLSAVEWGENNSPEGKNKGYTHCIMMAFRDQLSRDEYIPHRAHDALKLILRPLVDDIIVLDYSY